MKPEVYSGTVDGSLIQDQQPRRVTPKTGIVEATWGAMGDIRNILLSMQHSGWNLTFTEGSGRFVRPYYVTADENTWAELNRIIDLYG